MFAHCIHEFKRLRKRLYKENQENSMRLVTYEQMYYIKVQRKACPYFGYCVRITLSLQADILQKTYFITI